MDKTWYITTPIYYVNGRPHIGHAYTTIVADTLARWQRMRGRDVFFLTGTDEHGQKVLEKAQERGMSPVEHADDMVATSWRPTMEKLGISYDVFMRTTRPDHVACVQALLQDMHDRGLLYKDSYEGWYSPSAERFWTEKDLVDGKCPDTGQPVFKVEESNWFFKMSAWQEALVQHIEQHPAFIQPTNRRNEVLGFLRKPLGDLCISRPKARMSWGIPIPFDPEFVTYVWFDALLNYASAAGFQPGDPAEAWKRTWPADVQLVGKDILTTHAVYWTTMLMAAGLPLPTTIFAHGWWLGPDGRKMSKSLGNTVEIDEIVDSFGLDALRWFMLREAAFGGDATFSYDSFLNRYNADLANDLGNLAHRGLSMTANWLGGTVPEWGADTGLEAPVRALADDVLLRFDAAMMSIAPHEAMAAATELVRAGNKYIDDTRPWAVNKAGDTATLRTVLRMVLEISHAVGVLLHAAMPGKMDELLGKLGVAHASAVLSLRRWVDAAPVLDSLTAGTALNVGDPLFPRFREMPEPLASALIARKESAMSEAPAAPPPSKKDKLEQLASAPESITFDDFAKVALRVGIVREAVKHPQADKLLVLQVDLGEESLRQIVAGIAAKFAPEALIGRKVVVVANLAPVKLRGIESRGMLLAAGGKEVVDLVGVDAAPGDIVR